MDSVSTGDLKLQSEYAKYADALSYSLKYIM